MRDEELRKEGPPDTFDNTLVSLYYKCPRATYWFLRRLDYLRVPSYFAYGRAWGAAMNAWHEPYYGEFVGKEQMDFRRTKALLAARKRWEEEPLEVYENRPNDSWDNLVITLNLYIEAYGLRENWEQLRPEIGFRFPIPHTNLYYAGALDAYIHWEHYGVMAREDKAPGDYITSTYTNQWNHVSQIAGYQWALEQLVEKPAGILMNISSKRPRKENLLRFSRFLLKRSKWRIAEFMKHTVIIADSLRREWERWEWPKLGERNQYACAGGPAVSPCLYKGLCLQEMEPWEMEGEYNFEGYSWREKRWAPWEREGKDV